MPNLTFNIKGWVRDRHGHLYHPLLRLGLLHSHRVRLHQLHRRLHQEAQDEGHRASNDYEGVTFFHFHFLSSSLSKPSPALQKYQEMTHSMTAPLVDSSIFEQGSQTKPSDFIRLFLYPCCSLSITGITLTTQSRQPIVIFALHRK